MSADQNQIFFCTLPLSACQAPGNFDCSRLYSQENRIILFLGDEQPETECSVKIASAVTRNSSQRITTYSQVAETLKGRSINRVLAMATNPEGLLAAIATADLSGAPLALILSDLSDFRASRDADNLLLEALDKAVIAFGLSSSIRSYVQGNLGKRLWPFSAVHPAFLESQSADRQTFCSILAALENKFPRCRGFEESPPNEQIRRAGDTVPYTDPNPPRVLHWTIHQNFLALFRLRETGYYPEFIVDVGAACGYWSHVAGLIFGQSRFYLIEALLGRYRAADASIYSLHPEFITIESAVGDRTGEAEITVSPDLYKSSLFPLGEPTYESVRVPIQTLDAIVASLSISGRGLLKLDVQFAEHLVLAGAANFLKQVDAIFIEVSMDRQVPGAKTFLEMMILLQGLGFRYFDQAGTWREPGTGRLLQADAIFIRSG
jgi:FkbM family methyltransferase